MTRRPGAVPAATGGGARAPAIAGAPVIGRAPVIAGAPVIGGAPVMAGALAIAGASVMASVSRARAVAHDGHQPRR